MDALRIHGNGNFAAEFNCYLICKQRVAGNKLISNVSVTDRNARIGENVDMLTRLVK